MKNQSTAAHGVPAPSDTPPIWILLWLVALVSLPGAAKPDALNLSEFAPGLYVHQGRHAGVDSPHRDDIANIGFIIGEKCVAVIDTGGSITTGRQLRKALRNVTTLPVCYILNSHVHYDHILGNFAFRRDNAPYVGHKNLAAAVENNRVFFLESFTREIGGKPSPERIIGPDVTIGKTREFDLGNRKIKVTAHRTAHTDSDLSILDGKTNILWAADLLFVQRLPVINGSINGWIEESEKMASRDLLKIIPGHGAVPADWRSAVNAQLRYLKKLRGDVRTIIRNGGFLEDAILTAGWSEKNRWLFFEEEHKRNVTRAFAELEWE